jgi:hypothetical protein
MRGILGVAAFSLLLPAWIAAWSGTRALWGHEPLDRTTLVSANNLPARFSYLRGMKILPTLHADLEALDKTLAELTAAGIPPSSWYFTHATEWLVRAVPEARHAGLPLWLARGTTFSDDDTWEMAEHLERDAGIRVIFSYEGWNYWWAGLDAALKEHYQHRKLGRRLHVYQHREPPYPIDFAVNTHSNLHAKELSVRGGPAEMAVMSNGLFYFGGQNPHRIDIGFGLFRLEGELVGELLKSDSDRAVTAVFRIFAREGNRLTDKLWEETIEVNPTTRSMTRPFSISPGGRAVTLTLHLPSDAPATFGWRKLRTEHVGTFEPATPFPLDNRLKVQPLNEAAMKSLLGESTRAVSDAITYGAELHLSAREGTSELVSGTPSEIWLKLAPPAIHVAGEFRVLESAISNAATQEGLRVTVVAYKAGRLDVRYQRELHPLTSSADRLAQPFETWLPENNGWIGLVVTSLDGKPITTDVIGWRPLRVW